MYIGFAPLLIPASPKIPSPDVKLPFLSPRNTTVSQGRPDYYLTPTHDFTQYTRDCAEKYWNRDTAFDWNQSVEENLNTHLEELSQEDFEKIAWLVLPMVNDSITEHIAQIQANGLPLEEDALKAILECIPFGEESLERSLELQEPLKDLRQAIAQLSDRAEILRGELVDLEEQQRLGYFREGIKVKEISSEDERKKQADAIARLKQDIEQVREELRQKRMQYRTDAENLKITLKAELSVVQEQVLSQLRGAQNLLQHILNGGRLPLEKERLAQFKSLIFKRQLRGLKDIANHALVVEQSAIAPLSMGLIHYKRHREIQEAMTTFLNDEAKHSATFRRFLVEKLGAKEYISALLIKGANRYMWVARLMPSAGFFLAVIVEAIGAAYLEFFGEEKYMPDPLFRSISHTISTQDETRHLDLCVGIYNELYRTGTNWERNRNRKVLKVMMKSVYGDKTEDHHLIQAFRAFGVDSETLYGHIMTRLSEQLARVSLYVSPQELRRFIGS